MNYLKNTFNLANNGFFPNHYNYDQASLREQLHSREDISRINPHYEANSDIIDELLSDENPVEEDPEVEVLQVVQSPQSRLRQISKKPNGDARRIVILGSGDIATNLAVNLIDAGFNVVTTGRKAKTQHCSENNDKAGHTYRQLTSEDACTPKVINKLFEEYKPDVVVNTIGVANGPDVFRANVDIAAASLEACEMMSPEERPAYVITSSMASQQLKGKAPYGDAKALAEQHVSQSELENTLTLTD